MKHERDPGKASPGDRRRLIEALLRRREREGSTYAELARASGIPAGTLASYNWRRRHGNRGRDGTEPPFLEVAPPSGGLLSSMLGRPAAGDFEVVLTTGRRVRVPAGFDAEVLASLLEVLERPC